MKTTKIEFDGFISILTSMFNSSNPKEQDKIDGIIKTVYRIYTSKVDPDADLKAKRDALHTRIKRINQDIADAAILGEDVNELNAKKAKYQAELDALESKVGAYVTKKQGAITDEGKIRSIIKKILDLETTIRNAEINGLDTSTLKLRRGEQVKLLNEQFESFDEPFKFKNYNWYKDGIRKAIPQKK